MAKGRGPQRRRCCWPPSAALEHQVRVSHGAAHRQQPSRPGAGQRGAARGVVNAHTRIAPGAAEAEVRQGLSRHPDRRPAEGWCCARTWRSTTTRCRPAWRHLGRPARGRAVLRPPARPGRTHRARLIVKAWPAPCCSAASATTRLFERAGSRRCCVPRWHATWRRGRNWPGHG
jgi:hypothetical protein